MVIPDAVINDILRMMKYFFMLLLCLAPAGHAAEGSVVALDTAFWFMPRQGDVVAEHDGVRAVVKKLIANPDAYLALRYPKNETGELWGQELRAWLVSLGVVSDRIELQPGFDEIDGVALVVIAVDDEAALLTDVEAADMNQAGIVDEALPVVDVAAEPAMEEINIIEKDVVLEESLELKQE